MSTEKSFSHHHDTVETPVVPSLAADTPDAPDRLVPRQLPAQLPDLVGRDDELGRLDAALDSHRRTGSGAVVITAISGTAGVGKTSLAVHWAHRHRHEFVDGDLFINLRGFGPGRPVTPTEALDRFLRALHVPAEQIPTGLDAQTALYRTLLHSKQVLIVLDNAASAEDVRPLLPGSPGCLVLVTSRDSLAGLVVHDSARRVFIDLLEPDDAADLLRSIVGDARADREPAALAELARMCAYLPLALRIAGVRAAERDKASIRSQVDDLARSRLDGLRVGDEEGSAVRAVFTWSYVALAPEQARTFRLLGLHAGSDISVGAAAALTGVPVNQAARHLEALAGVHLIQEQAEGRFGFHDLLREFARERCQEDESAEGIRAALYRVLSWYLHAAHAANHQLMPQRRPIPIEPLAPGAAVLALANYEEALAWCEAERTNLVMATSQAAEHGFDDIAWQLPVHLRSFFNLRKHWKDWLATHLVALDSVDLLDNPVGGGWVLQGLGTVCKQLGQTDESIRYHQQALDLRRQAGDPPEQAAALDGLGHAHLDAGQIGAAIGCFQESLGIRAQIGHRHGEAWSLNNLGRAYHALGDLDRAVVFYERALPIRREVDDRWGEGTTLHHLGRTHLQRQRLDEAADRLEQARSLQASIGDRWGAACSMRYQGEVWFALGDVDQARTVWASALALFQELDDPQAAEVERRMAEVNGAGGGPPR